MIELDDKDLMTMSIDPGAGALRPVNMAIPLDCSELLPHHPPMLLAGTLVHREPERVTVSARIPPDGLFVNAAGELDAAALVELTAQAAAALKGCEARLRGESPCIGYLAGIRDFELPGEARAGDELTVEAVQEFAMDRAVLVRGEVRCGGLLLAAGALKVWVERDWPTAPAPSASDASALSSPALVPLSLSAAGTDAIGVGLAQALFGVEPGAQDGRVVGWFRFGEDFPGFRGHFPGYPILPAVVMPRLALALASARRERRLALRAIESAKITQGVFPGMPLRVEVTHALERGAPRLKLKVKLASPRGPVASFTLIAEE